MCGSDDDDDGDAIKMTWKKPEDALAFDCFALYCAFIAVGVGIPSTPSGSVLSSAFAKAVVGTQPFATATSQHWSRE